MKKTQFIRILSIASAIHLFSCYTSPAANFFSTLYDGTRNNHTGGLGFEFIPTEDLLVSALGRPVSGTMNFSHTIRIWEVSNQAQIGNVTVTPSSPTDSLGYKFELLPSSIVLSSGQAYRIVTEETSGGDAWRDVDDGPISNHSSVATISGGLAEYGYGTFPDDYTSGGTDTGYAVPTFYTVSVPEPSTGFLILAGASTMALTRRMRAKQ